MGSIVPSTRKRAIEFIKHEGLYPAGHSAGPAGVSVVVYVIRGWKIESLWPMCIFILFDRGDAGIGPRKAKCLSIDISTGKS